jgi:hypothetical protein
MGILERAASFISHNARPDGRIVQIGDNDSGRFLKPHPVFCETGPSPQARPKEDHLDCRGVIAAVQALSRLRADDSDRLDGALARALADGREIAGDGDIDRAARVRVGNPDELLEGTDQGAAVVELVVPGGQLCDQLLLFGYPDFGIWIFRSRRLHLAVRCGPSSSPRAGGSHAHNDQLAIDLTIDGEPWVTDPGSYLYCPPLETRNRWRSVTAHAAPQWPGREPARLDIGTFRLRDETRARCLYFGEKGFAGEHFGYGKPVRRAIALGDETITITDIGLPGPHPRCPVRCDSKEAVGRHFALAVPNSPGYGEIEQCRAGADRRMCHEHPDHHP